ncbi:Glycerophosphoryl diester phosphodiesterase [Spirosomataceae bacterium TFI 002]|nr:Glycerophosphoryl diester phosphodiesterase [Spirosomataceae bacterium TFI 002]
MNFLYIFLIGLNLIGCNNAITPPMKFADNGVVAHRGAWKAKQLPENSIAALRHAIDLNCTGSEFDVRITADSVLIVTHDNDWHDLIIEENSYSVLSKIKLSNGETLPTLRDYILAGMENNNSTGLVCELKPASSKEMNLLVAEKSIALVKELKAEPYILTYISFSYDILKRILELDPNANTQYLNGSKSPAQLKEDGIAGLDYEKSVFKRKPEWISSAKELGLALNAWTANTQEDLDWLVANKFNFITTNEPELLFERLKASPTQKGYELVWSDEFNYKGKPDSTKWAYDYRFIANQEKQYYTDSPKNARVVNGHLIIEAHKEQVVNELYNDPEVLKKSYLKYAAKDQYANYSSARLKTQDMASWQYGRIEVRAKLPNGKGLWPAIWMLGDNVKELGWPKGGEIDIMEYVGFKPDSIFGTIHTQAYNHTKGTQKSKWIHIDEPNEKFHVYAMEWNAEKMSFLLDGEVYFEIENEHKTINEWPFDQKFHLILNVAVGGSLGGQKGIDNSVFPQKMTVDYVRVFQLKN